MVITGVHTDPLDMLIPYVLLCGRWSRIRRLTQAAGTRPSGHTLPRAPHHNGNDNNAQVDPEHPARIGEAPSPWIKARAPPRHPWIGGAGLLACNLGVPLVRRR